MADKFIDFTTDAMGALAPYAVTALTGTPLAGFSAAALSSIVKNGAQACLSSIHEDFVKRQLSSMQLTRVEQVLYHAQMAYYEMIEKQGWELSHPEGEDYIRGCLEACEHSVINAINETQFKKIPFEGFLFASKFNSIEIGFDDFHMMASILLKMTWRELVLVQLFREGFFETVKNYSIINPTSSVEIYDLITWGLVKPEKGWVIENNSAPVPAKDITITEFGITFSNALLLEKISAEDKDAIVKTLNLKTGIEEVPVNRIHTIDQEDIEKLFEDKSDEIIKAVTPNIETIDGGTF